MAATTLSMVARLSRVSVRSASALMWVSRVISSSFGVTRSRSFSFSARMAAGPVVPVASTSRVLPS